MDRLHWIVMSCAFLPCLGSLVSWASPAAPAPVTAGAPRDSLSFWQYALSVRETEPKASVNHHFSFLNSSDKTVQIKKIKPSCGCLVTGLVDSRMTYAPGERGILQVSLPTANESPGQHDYTLKMQYNDGEDREVDLKFSVWLPAKSVRLEPKELYFYQYGDPLTKTLHVLDERNETLEVTEARLMFANGKECPPEVAKISIEPIEVSAEGQRKTPVRLEVSGTIPPEERIATLVIKTNDSMFKTMKVPVLIQPQKQQASQQGSVALPVVAPR